MHQPSSEEIRSGDERHGGVGGFSEARSLKPKGRRAQVVVAPPEQHWQTLLSPLHDGSLSGEWRSPVSHITALPLNERKAIAHRAMLEIDQPHEIINLGIGMPEVRAQGRVAGQGFKYQHAGGKGAGAGCRTEF